MSVRSKRGVRPNPPPPPPGYDPVLWWRSELGLLPCKAGQCITNIFKYVVFLNVRKTHVQRI